MVGIGMPPAQRRSGASAPPSPRVLLLVPLVVALLYQYTHFRVLRQVMPLLLFENAKSVIVSSLVDPFLCTCVRWRWQPLSKLNWFSSHARHGA